VDQQTVDDLQRHLSQVLVRPMDRVAGLKSHDAAPPPLHEMGAGLSGVAAVLGEGRILRAIEHPDIATEVHVAALEYASNAGMSHIRCAEDTLHFPVLIGAELLRQLKDGHDPAPLVGKRNLTLGRKLIRPFAGDREGDGDRPDRSRGEVHLVHDTVVVRSAKEAGEGAERAIPDQLEIGEADGVQRHIRKG
jgi:hypothetical protein